MLVVRLANDACMAVARSERMRRLSLIDRDDPRAPLGEEVRASASHGAQADDCCVKVCHSEVVETGVDSRRMLAAAALSLLLIGSQPRGALDPSGAYDSDGPSRVAEARPSDIGLRLSHGTQDASYVAANTATLSSRRATHQEEIQYARSFHHHLRAGPRRGAYACRKRPRGAAGHQQQSP